MPVKAPDKTEAKEINARNREDAYNPPAAAAYDYQKQDGFFNTDDKDSDKNKSHQSIKNYVALKLAYQFDGIPVHAKIPGIIQNKLVVNTPGDVYEKEADAVAEKVIQSPAKTNVPVAVSSINAGLSNAKDVEQKEKAIEEEEDNAELEQQMVQRKSTTTGDDEDDPNKNANSFQPAVTPAVVQTLQSGGRPLDSSIRTFMEPRFGFDFSKVRIHDDPQAQRSAKDMNALAYTNKNNIVFGTDQFQPQTQAGKKLLAHELTHVLQQADTNTIRRAVDMNVDDSEMSVEAGGKQSEEEMSNDTTESLTEARFIVENEQPVARGQMHKTEFLNKLNAAVCITVDKALEGTVYSSDNCPYIKAAFARNSDSSPLYIEQLIGRYATGTAGANSANDLIELILVRVKVAVEQWKEKGDMSGLPEEIRTEIYNSMQSGIRSRAKKLFFKARAGGAHAGQTPQAVMESLGKGSPLDNDTRSKMEDAFESDFSKVEVHTGHQAAGLSDSMNSKAFNVGNHIVFGSGEYKPGTLTGDALMAHELAHVVQQQSSDKAPVNTVSETAIEQDANQATLGVMAGLLRKTKAFAKRIVPGLRSGLAIRSCRDNMSADEIKKLEPLVESSLVIMNGIDPAIKGNRFEYEFKGSREAPLKDYMLQLSNSLKTLTYPGGKKIKWEEDSKTYSEYGYATITDARPILDEEGSYSFDIDLYAVDNNNNTQATITLSRTFKVVPIRKRTDKGFSELPDEDYTKFRAGISAQLGLLSPDNKPANAADPHITSSSSNPATAGSLTSFTNLSYQAQNSPTTIEHHWYIRPLNWDGMPDKVGAYKTIDDNGIKYYDLGTGLSATWPAINPNIYVLVCKRSENIGQGTKRQLPDLMYLQTILTEEGAKQLEEYKKYTDRVDTDSKKIPGDKVAIKAVHITRETNVTMPLKLFVGKNAAGTGYVLLDLTPGLSPDDFKLVYEADTQEALKKQFDHDNKYPKGEVKLEIPDNKIGLKSESWYMTTTGTSIWTALSGGLGIASLLLALGAIAAAPFTGGSSLLVTALIVGSAVTGAASATLSIVDNIKNQNTSKTRIAIDVVSIAGSVVGAGSAIRAARAGGNAILLANSATRYLLLANFGVAGASFLLMSVEGVMQIEKVLNSNAASDEKTAAIARILATLIISGALLALAHKDLKAVNLKINTALGEALAGKLSNEEHLVLALLDETTLGKLAGGTKEDMNRLVKAIREDPSIILRAARHRDALLAALKTAAGDTAAQLENALVRTRLEGLGMTKDHALELVGTLEKAGIATTELNLLDDTLMAKIKKLDEELRDVFANWELYKTKLPGAGSTMADLEAALTPARAAKVKDAINANSLKQKLTVGIPKKATPAGATPAGDQRAIVGGHSSDDILNDPNVVVDSQTVNPDGTISATYKKLLNPGAPTPVYSKVRTNATLAPPGWKDQDIIDATTAIAGNPSPFPVRPSDNASVHVGQFRGIEWEVIKEGGIITSSYPTGGTRRTSWP